MTSHPAFDPPAPARRPWHARFRPGHALPLLLALAALALAPPARAWETPAESLLAFSPDPRSMRAALDRLARSAATRDPRVASEALYWRGVSAAREGLADTAIACFERAARIFTYDDEQLARADAWIARGRPADLENAAALMLSVAPFPDVNADRAQFRARLAWSLFLAGRADSAMNVFHPIAHFFTKDITWSQRIGRAAEAARESRRATDLLIPVAIETRMADRAALEALHRSLGPNQEARVADLDAFLRQKVAEREAMERRTIETLVGRRLRFRASDGFPLGGALFAPAPGCPVAVVLMARGDSLALYDSLTTRFVESGFATVLVERRGGGASVGPGLALAGDAYGREEALENRIARDALDAIREAARIVPIDTTRIVVSGIHEAALTAIRAATLSPRVRALLLISPRPILIELGPARARLAKLKRPMFIQISMDEGYMVHDSDMYMDALYRSGETTRSRVVESRRLVSGAPIFRDDPALWPRIDQWLHEALSAPPATPPPASRKG